MAILMMGSKARAAATCLGKAEGRSYLSGGAEMRPQTRAIMSFLMRQTPRNNGRLLKDEEAANAMWMMLARGALKPALTNTFLLSSVRYCRIHPATSTSFTRAMSATLKCLLFSSAD